MVVPTAGSIVLVPFPFSDLSQTKLRPAVVIARSSPDDWILCQVTSNPYGDQRAINISSTNLQAGRLIISSYVRPGRLFTAHVRLLASEVGILDETTLDSIIAALVALVTLRKPT